LVGYFLHGEITPPVKTHCLISEKIVFFDFGEIADEKLTKY
jgi:hypothetical protein